jgi:hypothetical protein
MGATSGVGAASIPVHPNSPPIFSGVRVAQSLFFFAVFCRPLLGFFFLFCLVIVLSVLRYLTSDYHFGITSFLIRRQIYSFYVISSITITDVVLVIFVRQLCGTFLILSK